LFFGWLTAKLAARFPGLTFFEYTIRIIPKPLAVILAIIFAITLFLTISLEIRVTANIVKLYMFDRTPTEVIVLIFFLVVIYGVAGSRAALLPLNLMFLPIVLFFILLLHFFGIGFTELKNYKPVFHSQWQDVLLGTKETVFPFIGYLTVLFYVSLMKKAENAPKAPGYIYWHLPSI
jgi:spore germination protein